MLPYLHYPQLLGILLRMLNEGSAIVRREVMKTLGIIGALDPHTHKVNLAELQGEGKLEREGVRPQFPSNKNMGDAGACAVVRAGRLGGGLAAAAPGLRPRQLLSSTALPRSPRCCSKRDAGGGPGAGSAAVSWASHRL